MSCLSGLRALKAKKAQASEKHLFRGGPAAKYSPPKRVRSVFIARSFTADNYTVLPYLPVILFIN